MKKILAILMIDLFLTTLLFAALTEEKVIDKIEILEDGQIQVRKATTVNLGNVTREVIDASCIK